MGVLDGSIVVTAIRNEGPFLLEWLAWQKALGFAGILVLHNDCTDHSPQLLRLLERAGVLTQKAHAPDPDQPPQPQAHALASKHKLVREADWAFVCDVDEFLVIHAGDGTIGALAGDGAAPGFAGMAINWRLFGSSGKETWRDTLVHRRFLRSAPSDNPQNACFKTFFRRPADFARLRSHSPRGWHGPGQWNAGDNFFVLADGSTFSEFDPDTTPLRAVPERRITHVAAEVNHYAVQSREQFELKRGRPSAAMGVDRYTDAFFHRYDRNEEDNRSALTHGARFDHAHAALIAIPGALRLHHLCCADYVAAICEKRGDNPTADPRYRHHREAAAALPRH